MNGIPAALPPFTAGVQELSLANRYVRIIAAFFKEAGDINGK